MKKMLACAGAALCLVTGLLSYGSAVAQTPDSNPITQEYLTGNGLLAIGADGAYRLGWNGSGC